MFVSVLLEEVFSNRNHGYACMFILLSFAFSLDDNV